MRKGEGDAELRIVKLETDTVLAFHGLYWAVVTGDTDEIVAAFARVEHAHEFVAIYQIDVDEDDDIPF